MVAHRCESRTAMSRVASANHSVVEAERRSCRRSSSNASISSPNRCGARVGQPEDRQDELIETMGTASPRSTAKTFGLMNPARFMTSSSLEAVPAGRPRKHHQPESAHAGGQVFGPHLMPRDVVDVGAHGRTASLGAHVRVGVDADADGALEERRQHQRQRSRTAPRLVVTGRRSRRVLPRW
jgi:hypothetical protein